MTDTTKMTRLGDILLEKGLLSSNQLQEAVREQQRRREHINTNDKAAFEATSLGEVLIDLGYINRQQLKRGLNWQLYLRNMTLVMSLCAPLMSVGAAAAPSKPKNSSMSSQSIVASSVNSQNAATATSPIYELPITVQAENYTAMSGIETEPTTDVGGGMNVGYIHEGDWLSYSGMAINVPVTGSYKVTFRVASPLGGGSFSFHEADGSVQYGTIVVPSTGSSQTWVDVERSITLTAGIHKFGVTAQVRGSGFNINWFKLEYKGQPLPATIEAENYSAMLGVETEPAIDAGGGMNVGYIHAGDWMSYGQNWIDIPATGIYRVTYRVASPGGYGSFSLHEADGSKQHDIVEVPNTGSSQTWVNVVHKVHLTAGLHKFGITALVRGAGYNINWFKIEVDSDVPVAPPANSSSSLASSMSSSSQPAVSSRSSSSAAQVSSSVSSSAASSAPSSIASSSSAPSISSSSSSSPAAVSSSSSSAAAASNIVTVAGSVEFTWNIPTQRENGEPLYSSELGGYELRYRKLPDTTFTYITIEAWRNEHIFAWLEGTYEFEIAAFDINGLYSHFVPLPPRT